VDDGFADTDGDHVADCVDPDDDNDGVADALDCASLDAGSFGEPYEVDNVVVSGPLPTVVNFDVQNIGASTHYQVLVGLLSRLRATGSFQEDFCGSAVVTAGPWQDGRPDPPAGDGWYYQVRSVNGCGYGTLGSALADAAGAGDACTVGVWDADGDGSPSDLDCDDTNASVSPLNVELCDGLDNNCNQVVDEGFADTDGDHVADCSDCSPLNAGVWGVPVEVADVDVAEAAGTVVSWQQQLLGPATMYEVATGVISVQGQVDFVAGSCLGPAVSASPVVDSGPEPPAGTARYYMVKSRNSCGAGTYGTPARDTLPSCP
jgi:hypothetical protein